MATTENVDGFEVFRQGATVVIRFLDIVGRATQYEFSVTDTIQIRDALTKSIEASHG